MRKCIVGFSLAALLLVVAGPTRGEEGGDAKAVIDKAIKALGGEEKLTKALKGSTWKSKGKLSFMGNENPVNIEATMSGLDKYASKFKGEFNGQEFESSSGLNGNKGFKTFPQEGELEKDEIANRKRDLYLEAIALFVVPIKEKGFKCEAAGEEKVDNKAAAVVKITGPDGKDLKMYFDKETGLPVKQTAKVITPFGQEADQETTYTNYKDMGGIKKATKWVVKHNNEKLFELELVDFKVLDKVDAKAFDKP